MGGRSKQKGASFERLVCVALSKWVSESRRDDLFWRSAMSGGRATIGRAANKSRAVQAGDISAIDPAGHVLTDRWFIECKHYKDLNFKGAALTDSGPLLQFWRIARKEAKTHGKLPMVIARQNMYPTIMMVPCVGLLTANVLGKRTTETMFCRINVRGRAVDLLDFDKVLGLNFRALAATWDDLDAPQLKRERF